jgi:hypothetical protein
MEDVDAVVLAGGVNRIQIFIGIGLVPVLVEHPELTIDVDEAADYAFVKAHLEARR